MFRMTKKDLEGCLECRKCGGSDIKVVSTYERVFEDPITYDCSCGERNYIYNDRAIEKVWDYHKNKEV